MELLEEMQNNRLSRKSDNSLEIREKDGKTLRMAQEVIRIFKIRRYLMNREIEQSHYLKKNQKEPKIS